jgi:hypothetical protein
MDYALLVFAAMSDVGGPPRHWRWCAWTVSPSVVPRNSPEDNVNEWHWRDRQ